jgi:hypothetical protein
MNEFYLFSSFYWAGQFDGGMIHMELINVNIGGEYLVSNFISPFYVTFVSLKK